MVLDVQPIVLEGSIVRLEPLEERHARDLAEYAEPSIFEWFVSIQPTEQSEHGVLSYVRKIRALPNTQGFAVIDRISQRAIGSTSYLDIRTEHSGLEIGYTWYGRPFQGTKVNPEAKLLLMRHAFETMGCERVQLKTDGRNLQSQAAIAKLGAVKEGVLRKHGRMPDGFMRDTVMYSVVAAEWPSVRAGLLARVSGGIVGYSEAVFHPKS